jgi:hypothetical protein
MTTLEIERQRAVAHATEAMEVLEDLLPIAKAGDEVENWAANYTTILMLKLRVMR